jgi:hypothetical protein
MERLLTGLLERLCAAQTKADSSVALRNDNKMGMLCYDGI